MSRHPLGIAARLPLVLMLLLLAAFTVAPAQATSEQWAEATRNFTLENTGSCNDCHRIESNSNVVGLANIEVDVDATSVTLTPDVPSAPVSYSWRYREVGGVGPGSAIFTSPQTYSLSGTQSEQLSYCIGAHRGSTFGGPTDVHQLKCGTMTIRRAAPPDEPPDILSRDPAGKIALVADGDPVVVRLDVRDEAPDALVFDVVNVHSNVRVVSNGGGAFSFAGLSEGSGSVQLIARDGLGQEASVAVPFGVEAASITAPVVTVSGGLTRSLAFGETESLALTIEDDEPDGIEISATTDDASVLTLADTGTRNISVTGAGEGTASVTIAVSDSDGNLTVVDVVVTVGPPSTGEGGEPPEVSVDGSSSIALEPGRSERIDFVVIDEDVDSVTVVTSRDDASVLEVGAAEPGAAVAAPDGKEGRRFGATVTAVDEGRGTVFINVTDAGGQRVATQISVTAESTYSPPRIGGSDPVGPIAMDIGGSTSLTVSITLGSEGSAQVSATSADENVVAIGRTGDRVFRLDARGAGRTSVTFAVADSRGTAGSLEVAVNVAAPNLPPVAVADRIVYTPGAPVLDVTANDSDPEGGPLRVVLVSATSERGGTLAAEAAGVRYAPAGELSDEDRFDYQVRDEADQLSDAVTVTIVASDQDGDGVPDATDNCPVSPNPDQQDADSDDLGDVCDPPEIDAVEGDAGRELVRSLCLSCHLNTATGAPQIGDTAAWDARIAARGIDGIVQSAINGRGDMPTFGGQYDALQLTEATLFMAGRVAERPSRTDTDLDGVFDDEPDNCPRVPNPDQRDGDDDGIGDLCEPDADGDGDGYPFALDDNDENARRILLRSGSESEDGLLESASPLSLGRVARAVLDELGSGGAFISNEDFDAFAVDVYGNGTPVADPEVVSQGGVYDVVVREAQGTALLRVKLAENVPSDPLLQLYRPNEARWATLDPDGNDRVESAPLLDGDCPVSATSGNFSTGLFPGLGCMNLFVEDGGTFDADGNRNGEVAFVFRLASERIDRASPPVVLSDGGGGGGGGAADGVLALLVALGALTRLSPRTRHRSMRTGRAVAAVRGLRPTIAPGGAHRRAGPSPATRTRETTGPRRARDTLRFMLPAPACVTLALVLAMSLTLLTAPGSASAAGITALDLRFTGDSNPAKAEFDRDIESSSAVDARLSANLFGDTLVETNRISRGYSVDLSAGYGHDFEFDGLGESVYRLSGGFFHESKSRSFSPFYRAGVGLSWIDSETDIRDGAALDLSASINLQPAPFFDTTLGAGFESRQAETDVFDTNKARVFLTANFSPAPRLVLRTGARVVIGDEVSTATPTLSIVNSANVIEPDPAFGGAEEERFAYLIDATSLILEAGLGYDVSTMIEANLLFRHVSTEADGDIGYERDLLELTVSFNL